MLQDINSQNVSNKIKNCWAQRQTTWKHIVGEAKWKRLKWVNERVNTLWPVWEEQTFELFRLQKDLKTWRIESLFKEPIKFPQPRQGYKYPGKVQMSVARSSKQASSTTFYNQALNAVRFSRHQEKTHQRCPNLPDRRLSRSLIGQKRVTWDFQVTEGKKKTCQAGILHQLKLSIRNKGYMKPFSDK